MFSVVGYSQTINPPSPVVGVGFGILKETKERQSISMKNYYKHKK